MERIKCAVVGTGIFGEIHCHTYSAYENAELVIVCDVNEKKVKEIAKKYKTSYTTDYKEIVKNREIQLVSVATPDFLHKDITVAMLKSGKNVLVEKPMATKVDEAEEMVATAKKYGLFLMTDFHNRFNPPIVLTKERIEKGELGKIVMIYGRLSDKITVPLKWFSWSEKSGPHWFLFPHIVDLVCWFIGKLPKTVYAKGVKGVLKSNGVDTYDIISAILNFGDSFATIETSWIIPESWTSICEFALELQTSKGKVHMELENQGVMIGSDVKNYLERPFYTGYTEVHKQIFGFASLPIKHFVDCVREKKEPIIKGEDGLNNVKIIASIEESVKEEKIVEFKW